MEVAAEHIDRKPHPVADIFPMMDGEQFEKLCDDIQTHGLREPIWLHPDGRIIDGRNRYAACCAVGVEPIYRTWEGDGSLVEFVVSLNLHRRHLTSSQRAMIATKVLAELEAEAKSRMSAGGKGTEIIPDLGESREKAARLTNTNARYVSDAKKLQAEHPDLAERVERGELSINAAKAEASSVLVNRRTGEVVEEDDLDRVTTTVEPARQSNGKAAIRGADYERLRALVIELSRLAEKQGMEMSPAHIRKCVREIKSLVL